MYEHINEEKRDKTKIEAQERSQDGRIQETNMRLITYETQNSVEIR